MRVLIADDERHAREGLSAFLRTYPAIEIVGEVEDGLAAIELADAVHPDVLLLDLRMTAVDGIAVTRVMKARMPDVIVIILTMDSVQREAAMAAGADAFVSKGRSPADLVAALLTAHDQKLVSSGNSVPAEDAPAKQRASDGAAGSYTVPLLKAPS
jgi:DNA-binding NarL/FixJ family response regulator